MLYAPYTCDDIPVHAVFHPTRLVFSIFRLLTEAIFTSQGFSVHFASHSEVDRKTLAGEDALRLKNREYPTHWKNTPYTIINQEKYINEIQCYPQRFLWLYHSYICT